MPKFTVPCAVLPALSFAYQLYPKELPNRLQRVIKYVDDHISENPDILRTPTCEIGVTRGRAPSKDFEYANREHVRILETLLKDSVTLYCKGLPYEHLFLPTPTTCCGNELKIARDRCSQVCLYKTDGPVEAQSFHLYCSTCKTSYYHGFSEVQGEDKKGNLRTYHRSVLESDIIMTSRETAFQMQYLKEVSVDIDLGRSFEDISERYNRLYGKDDKERGVLQKKRMEDAYFLKKLLHFFSDTENLTVEISKVSNRIDIDELCDKAVSQIFSSENSWKSHVCDVKGCREGFVMCDGNEKLRRRICAAPRESLKLSPSMPKIVNKCGNSPLFGGRNQTPSKFCQDHISLKGDEPSAKKIVLTINVPDQIVSSRIVDISSSLPSNDDTSMHTACKKASNVQHFHDQTAGIMAIVRPCGIVLDCRELYTCESSSQLFVQLLKIVDEDNSRISYIGYDRACEFVPFLRNLSLKGNVGADKLLERQFLVDNFHISGHTTDACNLDSPLCEFHPKLPKFDEIADANTECAEQTFSWLKRYKNMVKYMTAPRFRFIMYCVIDSHNKAYGKRSK